MIPDWRRAEGHSLASADLSVIVTQKPDLLIIGLGHDARMKVLSETEAELRQSGIALLAFPTAEACDHYNARASSGGVFAALHLTC